MKIAEKYKDKIGARFGNLICQDVLEIRNANNRAACLITFKCDCGVIKTCNSNIFKNVFGGSVISCGCVKKKKWARSYYTWRKANDKV